MIKRSRDKSRLSLRWWLWWWCSWLDVVTRLLFVVIYSSRCRCVKFFSTDRSHLSMQDTRFDINWHSRRMLERVNAFLDTRLSKKSSRYDEAAWSLTYDEMLNDCLSQWSWIVTTTWTTISASSSGTDVVKHRQNVCLWVINKDHENLSKLWMIAV